FLGADPGQRADRVGPGDRGRGRDADHDRAVPRPGSERAALGAAEPGAVPGEGRPGPHRVPRRTPVGRLRRLRLLRAAALVPLPGAAPAGAARLAGVPRADGARAAGARPGPPTLPGHAGRGTGRTAAAVGLRCAD